MLKHFDSVESASDMQSPKSYTNLNADGFLEDFFDNPLLPFQATAHVASAINDLLQRGAEVLYDRYLLEHSPYYEAQDICRQTFQGCKLEIIQPDKCETPDAILNQFTEEPEPPSQRLDNLASLSIKTDYKIIYPEVETDEQSDTKSNTSRVSTLSRTSSLMNKMKRVLTASQMMGNSAVMTRSSAGNNTDGSIQQAAEKEKEEIKLIYVGEDEEAIAKLKAERDDPISEKLRDTREKKDKERQLDQARRQKMQQEEQEVDERTKERERQLRNKDFTHDFDGKIIFLSKNRGENIPNNDMLQLDCKNKFNTDIVKPVPQESEIPVGPVKQLPDFNQKKKQAIGIAPPQEFHKQPPLFEIMNPNAGVTIAFTAAMKKVGNDIKPKENHMSKKAYVAQISEQPNRPVPKYLLNQRNRVDINDQNNQIIELSEQSSTGSYNKNRRVKPQSAGMNIMNKEMYQMMLAEPSANNSSLHSNSHKSIGGSFFAAPVAKKPEESQAGAAGAKKKAIKDQIKIYEKKGGRDQGWQHNPNGLNEGDELEDLGIKDVAEAKKTGQNLIQIVEKFNNKIRNDPSWGAARDPTDFNQVSEKATKMKLPSTLTRVQSAKIRPDTALSNKMSMSKFPLSKHTMIGSSTTSNKHLGGSTRVAHQPLPSVVP